MNLKLNLKYTSPFSWTFKLLPISILKCKNKQPNRDRATINEVMQQFGLEMLKGQVFSYI